MDHDLIGQACALSAAITWAVAVILFKQSGERVPPLPLNLFKCAVGLILLMITLAVLGDGPALLARFTTRDIVILLISGIIGIALADTLFFHSLNLIGVGLVSIVDCLYTPLIILFSYLMLSEELTRSDYLGTALIILAVFLSSRHAPPAGRTRGQIALGVLFGAFAMALMAFSIVFAKPVLEKFPLIWGTTLRLFAGTLALAALGLGSPRRKEYWAVFRPSPVWWIIVPASVLATYLSMVFWIAGFKYTEAAIAAVLNQTSIIFALILATIFLKEPFSTRKLAAVTLAAAGVVMVILKIFDPAA